MTVSLRSSSTGDAVPIADILSDWIDETDWMPRIHTREEDRGFGAFLIEKTEVTVAEGEAICGFIALRGDMIDALYIAHDARGHGIGSRLVDHAKTGSQRLELWCFQANTGARAFYKRHGFVEDRLTDGEDNDEKLPDVHMTWTRGKT